MKLYGICSRTDKNEWFAWRLENSYDMTCNKWWAVYGKGGEMLASHDPDELERWLESLPLNSEDIGIMEIPCYMLSERQLLMCILGELRNLVDEVLPGELLDIEDVKESLDIRK